MRINIDSSLCNGCLNCLNVCPHRVIEMDDNKKATVARHEICIECAHCFSVCAQKAISVDFPYSKPGKSTAGLDMPTPEQVENLILTRRSIRAYSKKEVEKKKIKKILRLAAHSASTHNNQDVKYMVVGPDKAYQVEKLAGTYYKGLKDDLVGRITREAGFKILLGAPTTITLYSEKSDDGEFNLPLWNCLIAAQTMLLTAQSMGIGGCYNGLLLWAYNQYPKLQEFFDVPEDKRIYMFVVLGYVKPSVKYLNIINRKGPDILWI